MTGPYENQPYSNQPNRPAKRGFLASMSAALAPRPIPDDDGGPLKAPKGVIAAMVLSIVAGAVYVLSGGLGVITINSMLAASRKQYNGWINDCTSQFGGIGTTAVTESAPTGSAATCQGLVQMSGSDWNSFKMASVIVSAVFLVMGIGLIAAGVFLRMGRLWARRVTIAVTVITVLAAMMLGMTSPVVLGATLLLMISVVLCYVSSGATYFVRVKARRHA
ncbi:MAG: hypothetical protein ABI382_08560 [Nakamurella sp.]